MTSLPKSGLFLACIMLLSGCYTHNLQTARTTPKGKMEISSGGSLYFIERNPNSFPVISYAPMFRYGVADRFDIGITTGLNMMLTVDGKLQFVGTQETPYAMSIGLATGVTAALGGYFFQASVPLVASYFHEDNFAISLHSRPVFSSFTEDLVGAGPISYLQTGLGFRFGRTFRFTLEGSVMTPFENTATNPVPVLSMGISYPL